MSAGYTEADLAAAWEAGYWRGTSHEGPLNDTAVAAQNPHHNKGTTPAKACNVALKTNNGPGSLAKESTGPVANRPT